MVHAVSMASSVSESFGERAGGDVAQDAGEEPVPQHLEFVPVGRDLGVDGGGVPVQSPAGRGAFGYCGDDGGQFREPVAGVPSP